MTDRTQLTQLVKPFAQHLIHTNPSGGGSYVSHSAVNEKILAILGSFSWEKVEIIRGYVPAIAPNPNGSSNRAKEGRPALENAVVGYLGRLTCVIDGEWTTIEEAGDCEDPHNWPHDGARLKDATSDSFKRCAMRAGVGLHLWSQYQGKSEFFIYDWLTANTNGGSVAEPASEGSPSEAPPPTSTRRAATSAPPPSEGVQAFAAAANALTGPQRAELRVRLLAANLPGSSSEMNAGQQAEALLILNEMVREA